MLQEDVGRNWQVELCDCTGRELFRGASASLKPPHRRRRTPEAASVFCS